MKLKTSNFGEVEYTEENIITFRDGLYGFEGMSRFIYIPSGDESFQFNWLLSIDDPELVFVVTDPFLFVENYDFEVDEDIIKALEIGTVEDFSILSIVNIDDEIERTTINTKAPLLINLNSKSASQIILEEDYPFKYFIFNKELNEGK